jgi:hypothetical protein
MTNQELNPLKEIELDHPQRATRMIRGRKCQRKKWPRLHVSTMPKANVDVVASASISMMTKPQPPLRTPKGPVHLHRRRRERSPMPLHV